MIDSAPQAKEMISSYVASILRDLAILSQCIRQLEIFLPWATTFKNKTSIREGSLKAEFAQSKLMVAENLGNVLFHAGTTLIGNLVSPTDGKFFYPVDKRRTRENVELMRTAESNLDKCWRKVDELLDPNVADMAGTAVQTLLTQSRILQRTPAWVEPTKNETGSQVAPLYMPLSELYRDLERRTEDTRPPKGSPAATKTKAKTRGVADPARMPAAADTTVQPATVTSQLHFAVDERAHRVFKKLFFEPPRTATPGGEVAWLDSRHAMMSVGFSSRKLYGSVWQFEPTVSAFERSIQFHEPHPTGKIPYWKVRRQGRRLERAYGWHRGMFSVAEKGQH